MNRITRGVRTFLLSIVITGAIAAVIVTLVLAGLSARGF